jgi:hypothetical protein
MNYILTMKAWRHPGTRRAKEHHQSITKVSEQKKHQDIKNISRCPNRAMNSTTKYDNVKQE